MWQGVVRARNLFGLTMDNVRVSALSSSIVGCLTQIASGTKLPAVHTVELLDWATGGPKPAGL